MDYLYDIFLYNIYIYMESFHVDDSTLKYKVRTRSSADVKKHSRYIQGSCITKQQPMAAWPWFLNDVLVALLSCLL